MHDTAKYLIHADITASGVVERSDVVGAVFGQTEGLLGDDLDLRDLQESQKLGRIDVEVDSEGGQSYGSITIASGLDRVETAILAAALESIERVGPCRADIEVSELEDVRTATRREIVDRATELLAEYDESALTGQDIVEEVRESVRVEDITDFHGFPAGPRVGESDAVIVVEGRSDVLTLLRYGIKNAIAVEGTDVPEDVARLTSERTVTAFLDGDRGGDLILKELAQVGDIDHVALAPPGRSVEDLSRGEVMEALRDKVPFEAVDGDASPDATAATDGSARPAPADPSGTADPTESGDEDTQSSDTAGLEQQAESAIEDEGGGSVVGESQSMGTDDPESTAAPTTTDAPESAVEPAATEDTESGAATATTDAPGTVADTATGETAQEGGVDSDEAADADGSTDQDSGTAAETPTTLAAHVESVIHEGSGAVRALDGDFETLEERPAEDAFGLLDESEVVPASVVIDGELTQRLLDVAAQRGVEQVVCAREGEFVKQPTSVRVRTANEMV